MAVKIKIGKPTLARPALGRSVGKLLLLGLLGACAFAALVGFSIFGFFYFKYRGVVEERLKQPIFETTAKIYAAPREVRPGQKLAVQLIANELR
jgi:penicillin-binding protein 1B